MVKKPEFREIAGVPLNDSLGVGELSRILRKDVGSTNRFPGEIGIGAKKTGLLMVEYYGNASAGNASNSVDLTDLGITSHPIALVWYVGTVGKSGTRYPGGGLVQGSTWDTGAVTYGTEIAVTGLANYNITNSTLTVKLTSQNVGWTDLMAAYFYYVIYNDKIVDLPNGL